jgi:hypothetical protein
MAGEGRVILTMAGEGRVCSPGPAIVTICKCLVPRKQHYTFITTDAQDRPTSAARLYLQALFSYK